MASQIKMPKLSDTMEEGVIAKWLKKEGDRVESGDVLAEVETDKATMELELFEGGVIRKIFGAEGDGIPIGGVVAILADDESEDISSLMPAEGGAPEAAPAAAPEAPTPAPAPAPAAATPAEPAAAPAAAPAPVRTSSGRIKASPVARKLAEAKGYDLADIPGSGPGGRIVKRDVESFQGAPAGASGAVTAASLPAREGPETEVVKLTNMRKIIGARLAESKFTAPHFYVSMDVDMKAAIAVRQELKAHDVKFSFNDLVLKAVANALVKVPNMNATFHGDSITKYHVAHVAFAVAADGVLMTPVVRNADRKTLGQVAAETRDLIDRARNRKLAQEEYTGGTFTISNLGMYGVSEFTGILNAPAVGLLAVGGIRDEPVVEDGQVVPGKRMKITVSTDHRAADGADAATLLGEIKKILETPSLLLV